MLLQQKFMIMTRYDNIITYNLLLELLNQDYFQCSLPYKAITVVCIIILRFSSDREISWQTFYNGSQRVTYEIAL